MSNPLQNEDVIRRLEAAIGRWSAELTEAQTGLDQGFSKVRDQMGSLATGEGPPAAEVLQSMADALSGMRAVMAVLVEREAALEQAVLRAAGDLRAVRGDMGRADGRWDDLLTRIDRLADEVAGFKASEEYGGVTGDPARQDASDVAAQLAGALRDREEAHQEIVKLRRQLEGAREDAARNRREPGSAADRGKADVKTPERSSGAEPDIGPLEAFDADGQRRRLAEILVRAGVLTMDQVRQSLATQEREPHKRLGAILVERGVVSEAIVGRVLASQLRLPFVALGKESLDTKAVDLVGRKLASHHQCFPVRIEGGRLVLAMANPLDLIAIEDVELATGQRVDPVVAAGEDIAAAIERAYGPSVST